MRKEVFTFKGQNNESMHAVVQLPEKEPEMILQVVHGMTEHMGRYERFAQTMCDAVLVLLQVLLKANSWL